MSLSMDNRNDLYRSFEFIDALKNNMKPLQYFWQATYANKQSFQYRQDTFFLEDRLN